MDIIEDTYLPDVDSQYCHPDEHKLVRPDSSNPLIQAEIDQSWFEHRKEWEEERSAAIAIEQAIADQRFAFIKHGGQELYNWCIAMGMQQCDDPEDVLRYAQIMLSEGDSVTLGKALDICNLMHTSGEYYVRSGAPMHYLVRQARLWVEIELKNLQPGLTTQN